MIGITGSCCMTQKQNEKNQFKISKFQRVKTVHSLTSRVSVSSWNWIESYTSSMDSLWLGSKFTSRERMECVFTLFMSHLLLLRFVSLLVLWMPETVHMFSWCKSLIRVLRKLSELESCHISVDGKKFLQKHRKFVQGVCVWYNLLRKYLSLKFCLDYNMSSRTFTNMSYVLPLPEENIFTSEFM